MKFVAAFGIVASVLAFVPGVVDGYWFVKQAIWIVSSFIIVLSGFAFKSSGFVQNRSQLVVFGSYSVVLFFTSVAWPLIAEPMSMSIINRDQIVQNWNVAPIFPFLSIIGSILAINTMSSRLNYSDFEWISDVVCWITFGIICYGLFQFFGIDFIGQNKRSVAVWNPGRTSPMTVFGSPLASASFIGVVGPLMLKKRWWMIIPLTLLLGSMESGNTAALIGLFSGCLLFLMAQKRTRYFGLALLGCIPLLLRAFLGDMPGLQDRFSAWKDIGLLLISRNPLFGMGLGSIKTLFLKFNWPWYPLHNDLLQLSVEMGLIGAGIFCVSAICKITKAIRSLTPSKVVFLSSGLSYFIVSLSFSPSSCGALPVGCLLWAALDS